MSLEHPFPGFYHIFLMTNHNGWLIILAPCQARKVDKLVAYVKAGRQK
ncbi:hypothetical protein SCODD09_01576 [Streptococcus constellatus]|nr:hypothetical protein SCODD09_01576 [Streptococcus constellatus]